MERSVWESEKISGGILTCMYRRGVIRGTRKYQDGENRLYMRLSKRGESGCAISRQPPPPHPRPVSPLPGFNSLPGSRNRKHMTHHSLSTRVCVVKKTYISSCFVFELSFKMSVGM